MMTARQRSVTVDRLLLIEKLKVNLEIHRKDYIESVAGYRIKLKRDLENALAGFDKKSDREIQKMTIQFGFPTSYEKEYLDAIAMLEWSISETVELDQELFKQYVQNEWGWSQAFSIMNSTYKSFVTSAPLSASAK